MLPDVRAISLLWCCCLLLCAGCADQLMLSPSSNQIRTSDAHRIQVPLSSGGVVEVWAGAATAAKGHPLGYVLRFCGNGERAENALADERKLWDQVPVEVWAMNYPGFGGSSGPTRLSAITPAALAVYAAADKQSGGKPIYLSGFSLGTTVALYVAAHRPSDGLVLHSPPPVRDVILGSYGWWNLWMLATPLAEQFPKELDSVANARTISAPAVFIITGDDEVVPRKYQREVSAAYAGKKRVIIFEQGHHNSLLTAQVEEKVESGIKWLWQHPARGKTSR